MAGQGRAGIRADKLGACAAANGATTTTTSTSPRTRWPAAVAPQLCPHLTQATTGLVILPDLSASTRLYSSVPAGQACRHVMVVGTWWADLKPQRSSQKPHSNQ